MLFQLATKTISIRTLLFGMILILLLPVVALGAYDIAKGVERIRTDAGQEALRLARVTASDTARQVSETKELLARLAERPGVRSLDADHCDPVFTDFHKLHAVYANLLTKKLDGTVVCSSLPLTGPGVRQTNPAISIAEVVRTRAFVIGRPNRGFISGRWIVTLEYPLFDADGSLKGMVGAAVDLVRFNPLVGESAFRNLPEHTLASLIDDTGVILARSDEPEKWVGTDRSQSPGFAGMLKQHQGLLTITSGIDHIERLYAIVPVEGTRWLATVGMPTAFMNAAIAALYWQWLWAAAVGFGLTLMLTVWVERRISRPIVTVAETAYAVGQGRFDLRTRNSAISGVAEIVHFASQFDTMLDYLEEKRRVLAESDLRYRTLFNEMLSGFALHEIILGPDGRPCDYRFLAVNPAFETMTTLRAADIVGKRMLEVLPDLEAFWIEKYGHVALTGEAVNFEGYNQHLDKHFDVRAFRPRPGQFAVTVHDITERKRTEEAASETELRYRSLFENMLEGFAYCQMLYDGDDPVDFVYLKVNPMFEQLTGLRDVTGKKISEILPGLRHDNPELFEIYGAVSRTGLPHRFETYLKTLDIWLSIAVYGRGHDRFVAVFGNITERRKAEAEIRLLNTELEQRVALRTAELAKTNAELAAARDAAEAGSRAKSAFLANMSHELRTPLNSILGFSEMLLDSAYCPAATPRCVTSIGRIHAGGTYLLELINTILDLSKIESGKMEIELGQIQVSEVLGEVYYYISKPAEQKNIDINVDIAAELPALWADERAVKQILVNLLSNAVKFTPEKGKINVRAAARGDGIDLIIADTGIGIPPEHQERVLKPFEQLDNRYSRTQGGTGLGLSLVRGLVDLQGGRLSIESTVGLGTTFTVHLPAARPCR